MNRKFDKQAIKLDMQRRDVHRNNIHVKDPLIEDYN